MPRKPDPDGQIQVRVTPRSSQSKIALGPEDSILVWTTAAPTDGQANAAVCEIIAKRLGIPKSRVAVVRGDTSRNKTVKVENMTAEEVRLKLEG